MLQAKLFVRVISEVADEAEAQAEARLIAPQLEPFAPVVDRRMKQYYKFPECWDIVLKLRPATIEFDIFYRLVELAEAGWYVGKSEPEDQFRWAVWNPEPGVELLTPRVRWAELQMWLEDPDEPQEEIEYIDDLNPEY
jgi:hypothetical protein